MTPFCRSALASGLMTFLLTPTLRAESHVFTTTEGKFLRGELVSANEEQAVVKGSDGQMLNLPLKGLIGADQDYVTLRMRARETEVQHNFEVSWTKEKVNSTVTGVKHTKITKTNYITHIKIRNLASQPTGDMDLHYQLYYIDVEGKKTETKHKDGVIKLPSLGAGATTTVDSESVELDSSQLAGGYYYISGASAQQKDSFKGIVVTFKQKGQKVFEYVTPGLTKAPQ